MKLPRLLAVWFLIFGTSFLFLPQAHANMGLQAYYYDNYTPDNLYNGAPPIPPDMPMVASIPVATVDQDYDLYPLGGLIDDFVVKYEGYLTATESATVDLQCLADDGCIVIIDGVTVIDEWWDKGTDGGVYQYTLVPNQSLSFIVWYYENGGGAVIQLRWQFPNGDWAIVPESVFSTVPIASPSPEPSVSPEPSPSPTPSDTPSPEPQPVVEPTETPTVVVTPSPEPEPLPSPVETQTPTIVETSTAPSETSTVPSAPVPSEPLPEPVPIIQPQPVVVPEPPAILEPSPTPPEPEPEIQPEPAPEPQPEPELEVPPEPAPEPPAPGPDPEPEPNPEPPIAIGDPPPEEVPAPVIPEPAPEPAPEPPIEEPEPPVVATEDSTPEERAVIADALIEAAHGEPVTAADIQAAGLTYEDLPPETPVEVRKDEDGNEVVITAEVAAALVVLESPAALVEALFTDPAQALLAIASIGADMSDEERAESEKIIVASVIAGQAAVGAAGAAAAAASTYRRKP